MIAEKLKRIFNKIICLISIQLLLLGNISIAQEISTLSPAVCVSSQLFESTFINLIAAENKRNVVDIVFDKKTDVQVINDILRGKLFRKIGNGATLVVFGDGQNELVLKIPLKTIALRQEERNFIDNNGFLKKIDIFIKTYIPHKFANAIKQKLKSIYYGLKKKEFDPNTLDLQQLSRGYLIAEKRKFKNVLHVRVIPNISNELNIRGIQKSRLLNEGALNLFVSEQIDSDFIVSCRIRTELKRKNLDAVFKICDLVFEAQMELWKEGGYDLDRGMNLLENWAIMQSNECKLVDMGALSEDQEKARKFFSLKVSEAQEILELVQILSLKETIKMLVLRKNDLAHNLVRFQDLFPDNESAKKFTVYFCENIIKYCDPKNIGKSSLENSFVNSFNYG
ncbi:MAG: hypothetical protein KKD05_00160, partial [Candidatus Omnitrophica bacterium]|nr:hypothetical protein [Candidatus Omnitrophota bacterium]